MDWTWFLFSFKGRVNRAKVWLVMLIIVCCMLFLAIMTYVTAGILGRWPESVSFGIGDIFRIFDPAMYRSLSLASLVPLFFHLIGTPLLLWIYLATSIKRLHDRDKRGWWMIAFFVVPGLCSQFPDRLGQSYAYAAFAIGLIAIVLSIWGFIEIYCLRGTPWTNQFGPNPLPKVQTRPRTT